MISPRLVYHPRYDIRFFGFERLHPFDSRRPGRAYGLLERRFGRALRRITLRPDRPISREELLAVHTDAYLQSLKQRIELARALEVPQLYKSPAWLTDWCVLRAMRWATRGTILAAEQAMRHGLAINLSGGYHHARPDRGEGFCIYNDVALGISYLRRTGALSENAKVTYVDLDAHQGNGVCQALFNDPRVFIFDMFNGAIYPALDTRARRRIDCAIPLKLGTADVEYLGALKTQLPPFLNSITRDHRAELAIYNAGSDIFVDDPLGALGVSAAGVLQRDQFVLTELLSRGLPTLMLPSGGYTAESHRLVANSIEYALTTWGDSLEP